MTTELATIDTIASRFLAAADQAGINEIGGKLLKFSKGKYFVGDDEVPLGTEYVAQMPGVTNGWVKFVDGKVAEQKLGRIADGFIAGSREALGDTDESNWERDGTGRARDPWSLQYYVPLLNAETGELVVFVTGSRGGIGEVSKLCRIYARQACNGLPVIKLSTRAYKHKDFGRIETPSFDVVTWEKLTAEPLPPIEDELSDSIPF
jgi:hypothetical protein